MSDELKYLVETDGVIKFSKGYIKTLDELPVGFYQLGYYKSFEDSYFYLQKISSFLVSDNLGDIDRYFEKIKNSYLEKVKNNKSMGVLFTGLPGTGKTYTMKYIVLKLIKELNLPVIIINSNLPIDTDFYSIMSKIKSIIVIDEFEKIYPTTDDDIFSESSSFTRSNESNSPIVSSVNRGYENHQAAFLTLLDGTIQNSNLYLITSNGKISKYLMQRPGRLKYVFNFNKLSNSIILNYLDKKLNDLSIKEEVYSILNKIRSVLSNFSFDILETIVEEINVYGITDTTKWDILNILNIGLENRLEFSVSGLELEDGKLLSNHYFNQFNLDTLEIPSYILFTKDIYIKYLKVELKFEDFILEFYPDFYSEVVIAYDSSDDKNLSNVFDKFLSLGLSGILIDNVQFLENSNIKLILKEPLDLTKKIKTKLVNKISMTKMNQSGFTFSIKSIILSKNNLTSLYETKRDNFKVS